MPSTDPLSQLEKLIFEAEARFGPREKVALTAVGFARVPNPITLFSTQSNGAILLTVAVGEALLIDEETLIYQLAHEAVHCLAHSSTKITWLEEGVATLFGLDNALVSGQRAAIEEGRLDPDRVKYLAAVRCLLKTSPDAVRLLRAKSIKFENITAADIEALGASAGLAADLCQST